MKKTNYKITPIDKHSARMTGDNGTEVTILFLPERNDRIENLITESLLKSYENRCYGISENEEITLEKALLILKTETQINTN